MVEKVVLIVLDSVGIGELPDAHLYNDEGSNTIGNIAKAIKGFELKNLQKLGLGNIEGSGLSKNPECTGSYGKLSEISAGKDTTTGHWEISGLILEKPLPTFPNGFPKHIMDEFEAKIGTKTLGNEVASGTEIIQRLGDEHVKTGYPIIYTSADSGFQIAAHEEVIPIERLYEICNIAREMLKGEYAVGRVIARPFVGASAGNYTRTTNRKDISLQPVGRTILDIIKDNGKDVMAVGKIEDIFCGQGITEAVHTHGNMDGIDKTIEYMKTDKKGLIFTNLVDFDMLYGHRNNVQGYADALIDFDNRLPEIIGNLNDNDVLIITADHGCDPTTPSTDHSREYIPVLVYGKQINKGVDLGIRNGFCDIGATVLDLLDLPIDIEGKSFKKEILNG